MQETAGTSMVETHFSGHSTKTLPGTVGRHDGHADGHLNCVAIRHGWTRTFSISPEELAVLDYESLERILEVNTLRLRPVGVRIFIEQPADSGSWSKVRPWKHDTSLQTILVQKHFAHRMSAGVITRFDVRDGSDRKDESDSLSLRSVGSRIVHGIHHRGETSSSTAGTATATSTGRRQSWFGGLIRRPPAPAKGKKKQLPVAPTEDEEEDDEVESVAERAAPKQQRPTSIFGYLNPLSLFSVAKQTIVESVHEGETLMSPNEAREAEVENLRKRGWIPPGLKQRQKSLRDRLRASEGNNPFLGGSRVYLRAGKKSSTSTTEVENPFTDQDASELTPQEVDEFFEIDRTSSIMEMNNQPANVTPTKDKSWPRFKGKKKNKPKKGDLGGANVIGQPEDAFPDSPFHSSKVSVATSAHTQRTMPDEE
ncbi:unnamed protein product [Mycena citricolor]|uniref:Uncharacterized protein n=1 Tax=Mycena citricolor TaxID=2018698 RepID=A0AAD2K5H2_9AGAR|nr:unnamed protein product [Mycena citricolor]